MIKNDAQKTHGNCFPERLAIQTLPNAVSNPPPWQGACKSQELAASIAWSVLGNIAETCAFMSLNFSGFGICRGNAGSQC